MVCMLSNLKTWKWCWGHRAVKPTVGPGQSLGQGSRGPQKLLDLSCFGRPMIQTAQKLVVNCMYLFWKIGLDVKKRELSFIVMNIPLLSQTISQNIKKVVLITWKLWKNIVTLSLYAHIRVLKRGINMEPQCQASQKVCDKH